MFTPQNKTVDQILSVFTKALKDLEDVVVRQDMKVAEAEADIVRAQCSKEDAIREQTRATNVIANIKQLVG